MNDANFFNFNRIFIKKKLLETKSGACENPSLYFSNRHEFQAMHDANFILIEFLSQNFLPKMKARVCGILQTNSPTGASLNHRS